MDKQSIFLIIFCLLLVVFWEPILNKIWPPPPPPPPGSTNLVSRANSWQENGTNHPSGAFTNSTPPPQETEPLVSSSANPILSRMGTQMEEKGEEVKLENDDLRVWFTPRGGGIGRVEMKKFMEGNKAVQLNQESPIPSLAVSSYHIPYCANYRLQTDQGRVTARLEDSHAAPGIGITKEFHLEKDHLVEASIKIKNNSSQPLNHQTFDLAIGMAAALNQMDRGNYSGIWYMSGEKASNRYLTSLLKSPYGVIQPINWGAINNQYFTLLVTPSIPFTGLQAESYALPEKAPSASSGKIPPTQSHGALTSMTSPPFDLAPGAFTNFTFQVYAGPKDYQLLSELGENQDKVMDFRLFRNIDIGLICKPILWFMRILHGIFRNWGIAIIGITIALKIFTWPFAAKSTRAMKQMQALAPKISALKEKYPDNPQKQYEEQAKLFREYGINPAAGCLPMLIQLPIFTALYCILGTDIALRGASFLWIADLSRPDTIAHLLGFPINLMPLLMAVTMIWQTRITPQSPSADPSMKMMMWFMPGMFLFFCYNFSSGLSLYWMVQNLLTILQTYMIQNQKVEPPQKIKRPGGSMFSRPSR